MKNAKKFNKLKKFWLNINCEDRSGFNFFSFGLIVIYSLLVAFGIYHHEPWRDEAQAWLIARDLNFFGIINQMCYEGTPALWHLIIAPFAKAGLPYFSINIIHLVISIGGISVFVIKSDFSKLFKILFIFSYYLAYEYAVVARNYSLTILFLFLIASMYEKRFEKPIVFSVLIFFLFNTNVFGAIIAFAISSLFVFESLNIFKSKKIYFISWLIILLSFIFLVFQLIPPDANIISSVFTYCNYIAPAKMFTNAFIPLRFYHHSIYTFLFFTLLVLVFCISLIKKPKLIFLISITFSGFIYVFVFKHGGYHRHHAMILVFMIYILWIQKYYKNNYSIIKFIPFNEVLNKNISVLRNIFYGILMLCLSYSVVYSFNTYYKELKYNFSGAKDMGDFIKNDDFDDYEIAAFSVFRAIAVIPYINQKSIWYVQTNRMGSFGTWDKHTLNKTNASIESLIKRTENKLLINKKVLVLVSDTTELEQLVNFELIYETSHKDFWIDGETVSENYWLYKPL